MFPKDWSELKDFHSMVKFLPELRMLLLEENYSSFSTWLLHKVLKPFYFYFYPKQKDKINFQDWMAEAHKQNKAKCLKLVDACRESGWGPPEVGCKGFQGNLCTVYLGSLASEGCEKKIPTRNITKPAKKKQKKKNTR